MRTLPSLGRAPNRPLRTDRSDASVRDSVRILTEIVTQLSERIELLEAREALYRVR